MKLSIVVARILAVVYLSAGLGAIVSADQFRRLPDDLFRNAGLTYVTGLLAVVLGMLIVLYHPIWTGGRCVLVTLVGWLALLKGVAIIVAPQWVHGLSAAMVSGWGMTLFPYAAIVLGLLFGYFGFRERMQAPDSE